MPVHEVQLTQPGRVADASSVRWFITWSTTISSKRHRWLPGDVVIWDNRSTMHYAVYDYGDADRVLNRVMIEGEAPHDAPYDD